jgi:hypothetical protein
LAQRANELSGGRNPRIIGTLAVAYAEAGQFAAAAAAVQRALPFAAGEGNATLAGSLRSQLALFQAGSPFRDPSLAAPGTPPSRP